MNGSLRVYRDLLRAARSFPVQPVARKLESNIKEVTGAFIDEQDPDKVCALHEDGRAALRVIAFLKGLPQVNPWRSLACAYQHIVYPPAVKRCAPVHVIVRQSALSLERATQLSSNQRLDIRAVA